MKTITIFLATGILIGGNVVDRRDLTDGERRDINVFTEASPATSGA